MSETRLVSGILRALITRDVFAWRANSGMTVIPATSTHARRVIRGSAPGTPDILLVLRSGRLRGLECKSPKGLLRESQIAWIHKVERFGVLVEVVRSIGQALQIVDQWISEDVERNKQRRTA